MVGFAQTLYFVGMIFGVLTFGIMADIFGRKSVLIPLLVCACITGRDSHFVVAQLLYDLI